MPARTKGRAKIDFRGRPFLWWVDGDRWLRILSLDKKFVIAMPLGRREDEPDSILVAGSEFPGIEPTGPRPIRLTVPPFVPNRSMGGMVEQLLQWCFDPLHELRPIETPVQFA